MSGGGTHHPIPEFRDADHFWGAGHVVSGSHEIIRPKPRRPGDLHRQSADAAMLLKNGGYNNSSGNGNSPAAFVHHQQQQQQHQSNQQPGYYQQPGNGAAQQQLIANGKSPSRDLGGGSTPALKSHPPRDAANQNFRNRDITNGIAAGRSPSRERLVQSQILCLPPPSSSRELMARDSRDAWDYYGPPVNSVASSNPSLSNGSPMTASLYHSSPGAAGGTAAASVAVSLASVTTPKVVGAVYNRSASAGLLTPHAIPGGGNAGLPQQHSSKELREFRPAVVHSGAALSLRDQRFAAQQPTMKFENTNTSSSTPSSSGGSSGGSSTPQRLLSSAACVGVPLQRQAQAQQQHYPHYNAKLESLTHRMPNLSFDSLGQHPNMATRGAGAEQPTFVGPLHVHGPSPAGEKLEGPVTPLAPSPIEVVASPCEVHGLVSAVNEAATPKETVEESSAPPVPESDSREGIDSDVTEVQEENSKEIDEDTVNLVTNDQVKESMPDNHTENDEKSDQCAESSMAAPSHNHASGQATPESTDCSSLSKSSSDGDPVGVVSRKRPPTKLKTRRRMLSFPHHISVDELRLLQRRQELYGGSSSDENRSSGHASMSDGHTSSSPPAETLPRHTHYRSCLNAVPEDDKMATSAAPQPGHSSSKAANNRRVLPSKPSRHRMGGGKDELSSQLEHATGLEDIKMAIEQLTLRSHGSRTSYSTSTYSSLSGSEGGEPMRRLIRHSSLETINTNVTVADEFVWVDSYNRLVELQQLPWSNHDVLKVIQNGRLKEHLERVSMETIPRLSYLLQRALVRVAREAQRLARPLGMCSKQEVCSALRIVLSPALADSCIKACLRAAAMFTVSGDMVRQSKSARAGLQLSVGKVHRWMCDVRLGKFIHDYAAVYLAAGLENLLEEIMIQCLPPDQETLLTASVLEHAIANNGDLWGLLQPYAHLNAGRTATGALALPRWPSQSGVDSSIRGSSTVTADDHSRTAKTLEQSLLTTCVGSLHEINELLQRVTQFHFRHSAPCPGLTPGTGKHPLTWAPSALHALFYFMRCSQLEHAEHAQRAPIQELVYERPYIVLPPLIEWVRVANAHAEHRHSLVVDKDDVSQAARLLLPGVDCPVRLYGFEDIVCPRRNMDDLECSRKLKIDLAFKMLSSARSDLIPHALQLLPSTKINTVNERGLTPLMVAAIRGDEVLSKVLIDAGADVDAETPTIGSAQSTPGAHPNPETQHWTALTYAAIQGHIGIAKLLLENGANVEGGGRLSEDKCTETPLQVVAGSGNVEMVSLLLSYGARPFLSTLVRDSLCYSSSAQKGCYSAIAVAAGHGQRSVLHKLLSHPLNGNSNANSEVLSLEEILAEGASQLTNDKRPIRIQVAPTMSESSPSSEKLQLVKLNKGQIKTLQEAMYQSAENAHLDITLDLRNLGVPWTLHCWMHTLATAHEHGLESIIDQLLQDFLQVWGPEDYSAQFVDECLPLLFNIFRYSKNEGTTLLLADIFATCFGRESIKEIRDTTLCGGPRIDPKFVNNPELSDVQFRVEGRVFYAHKIVLITASARFKSMLNSKFCEGNPPIIQINDIRYDIFQMVMNYLYKGGCENLNVDQNDVLELMAAANFFQLEGLLRFCESRCSALVDLDNIVSMYIHAKVYNAVQLLEYCQGFLLQNMVALLTYDDSVRRLIFGKKLHNHDVLAGLLLTLQARIKSRSPHKK